MRSTDGRIGDRFARLVDAGLRAGSGDQFHRGDNIPNPQLGASSVVICSIYQPVVKQAERTHKVLGVIEKRVPVYIEMSCDEREFLIQYKLLTGSRNACCDDSKSCRLSNSWKHIKLLYLYLKLNLTFEM